MTKKRFKCGWCGKKLTISQQKIAEKMYCDDFLCYCDIAISIDIKNKRIEKLKRELKKKENEL